MKKALPILLILLGTTCTSLSAQTLGQFAGASAAEDGEGSVFMLAGNNTFRTGVSARFNISRVSDFGLQLGLDRSCSESFFGGGIDFKIVILESTARLPVNLALDASFGSLTSGAAERFHFGFGILASGRIASIAGRAIEPYCSLIADIEQIDMKHGSTTVADCLCPGSNDETDAGALVRVGVKIPVSNEAQLLIEANLARTSLFGAGINIIF
ncbi:MAG: hypothetical protein WC674_03010 [Candidatus Krumholzibacteriia bacterium]